VSSVELRNPTVPRYCTEWERVLGLEAPSTTWVSLRLGSCADESFVVTWNAPPMPVTLDVVVIAKSSLRRSSVRLISAPDERMFGSCTVGSFAVAPVKSWL